MPRRESNPCLDEKFWCLVSHALSTNGQASLSKANHMWLNPLLLRYPLLPLMSTVMCHARSVSDKFFLECYTAVRAIAAYSTTKPTYDSSWELFLATISAVVESPQNPVHGAETVWLERPPAQSFILLAIEHCRPTLCEGNNKKKVRFSARTCAASLIFSQPRGLFAGTYCFLEWVNSHMGSGAGKSPEAH
jgi:hypothetical protein